jgi:hypothetical protein
VRLFYSCQLKGGDLILLPQRLHHSEAMVQCVKKFLPLYLTYFLIFQRTEKKKGKKLKKECKLSCQSHHFEISIWGKIDSSLGFKELIVYILFEDSRLKTAMNRLQFILQISAL